MTVGRAPAGVAAQPPRCTVMEAVQRVQGRACRRQEADACRCCPQINFLDNQTRLLLAAYTFDLKVMMHLVRSLMHDGLSLCPFSSSCRHRTSSDSRVAALIALLGQQIRLAAGQFAFDPVSVPPR